MTISDLLDTPIEALPFVDRHAIQIAAPPQRTWDSLVVIGKAFGEGKRTNATAHALGCRPLEIKGGFAEIGSTIPGFLVTRSVEPAVLAMMGEHRYSRYALIFRIIERRSGLTELSAETRARFPGAKGTAYRAALIGSKGHIVVTSSVLRAVRKRAEHREPEGF